jgi:hypothetical protein
MKQSYILSGVSKSLATNTYNLIIDIPNKTGKDLLITGFIIKYKSGLENVLIDIKTPETSNNPFIQGQITLGALGSSYDNNSYFAWKLPSYLKLSRGSNIQVYAQTFSTPINDRDITVSVVTIEE